MGSVVAVAVVVVVVVVAVDDSSLLCPILPNRIISLSKLSNQNTESHANKDEN
jgi:hypothetical protein